MGDNQHRRIDFVDLTKGVCIILVVMAHIGGAFDQLDKHSMLSCFRMPLYFFISGIFFKPYEGLYGFIIRKTNKLIIPFIFFYVSAFLLKYIVWKIALKLSISLCHGENYCLSFTGTTSSSSILPSGFCLLCSTAISCSI